MKGGPHARARADIATSLTALAASHSSVAARPASVAARCADGMADKVVKKAGERQQRREQHARPHDDSA